MTSRRQSRNPGPIVFALVCALALFASACSSASNDAAIETSSEPAPTEPEQAQPDEPAGSDTESSAESSAESDTESDTAAEPEAPIAAEPTQTATEAAEAAAAAQAVAARYTADRFGPAPPVPDGPLDADTAAAVETLMGERLRNRIYDEESDAAIDQLGASGDPRVAWLLSDMLRIAQDTNLRTRLSRALEELVDQEFTSFSKWREVTDHLIAWDIPAPPDYLTFKRNAYLLIEPRWEPLFTNDADLDWRYLSWGGVLIDDRPFGETDTPCNCIPAADNPPVTDAATGDEWLDPETVVFGVAINGEARAYPRSAMEVREMVNDTLGGRDFAMPYCTLCGSAQVYFTDADLPGFDRPVLRTSGLLIRSNKVMYDVNTLSIFDTFKGRAVSGPLFEAGVALDQHSVVTTTWQDWKQEHPDTTVLEESVALGRPDSDLRNSRDGDGPIFPIGVADNRLGVQADVLGVLTATGTPLAFDVATARTTLEAGGTVTEQGISLVLDGGGVRAVDDNGDDAGGHQAFWFAWSQFYPDTALWVGQ